MRAGEIGVVRRVGGCPRRPRADAGTRRVVGARRGADVGALRAVGARRAMGARRAGGGPLA
jgi:hypothetical protein